MPGQDSILGLASSFDPSATSYTMQTEITSNPNIITNMIDLQMNALKTYYKLAREKPKAIIFFRTAVNEHQMQQTLGFEYRAIKSACRMLEQDYEPTITYIMATKKHATRLCATDKRFQIGKSQNVPAGTVVDTAIVDRSRFDFYLQSSQGIQGKIFLTQLKLEYCFQARRFRRSTPSVKMKINFRLIPSRVCATISVTATCDATEPSRGRTA
jgi:eukaryotic translation initiation factor 2C